MKQNLTFVKFEEKEGFEGKKHFSFTTVEGATYNCYDLETCQDIMVNMKIALDVELITSKNGKEYIKAIHGIAQHTPEIKPANTIKTETTNYNNSNTAPLSMWVSYAKDILIAMANDPKNDLAGIKVMANEACELVKQMRNKLSE